MPNDLATTAASYGVVVAGGIQNSFNNILAATYAELIANVAIFRPVVAAQANPVNGLLALARTLHANGAAGLLDRVANMAFLNQRLGANLLALPNQVTHLDIQQLRAAYSIMNAGLRLHLRIFYLSRNTPTRLRDLVALCAPLVDPHFGASRTSLLATICTVAREVPRLLPGYAGSFDGLARPAIGFLNKLRMDHPPDAGFAGFTQWGAGNHASVAANQKWHFLKHVCMIDDGGGGLNALGAQMLIAGAANGMAMEEAADLLELLADEDDGPALAEESGEWWRALNIQLPWATCTALIHDPVELARIRPWFHNGHLLHSWVPEFVGSGVLSRCAPVLGYLMTQYQAAYCAYAIHRSRNADRAFVSSNGAKVFIALCKGDDFIIGRYNAAGQMGISSCYKPTDLAATLRGARDGLMWQLIRE